PTWSGAEHSTGERVPPEPPASLTGALCLLSAIHETEQAERDRLLHNTRTTIGSEGPVEEMALAEQGGAKRVYGGWYRLLLQFSVHGGIAAAQRYVKGGAVRQAAPHRDPHRPG